MSVTETVATLSFSRLKGTLIKLIVGLILVPLAIYFLFINAGRSIEVYPSLIIGAGLALAVLISLYQTRAAVAQEPAQPFGWPQP